MGTLVIEKEKIRELLNTFPDDVKIDDLIDQLIITAKLEQALTEFANGQFLTPEQLDEEVKKW
jgi:hypothetical protein